MKWHPSKPEQRRTFVETCSCHRFMSSHDPVQEMDYWRMLDARVLYFTKSEICKADLILENTLGQKRIPPGSDVSFWSCNIPRITWHISLTREDMLRWPEKVGRLPPYWKCYRDVQHLFHNYKVHRITNGAENIYCILSSQTIVCSHKKMRPRKPLQWCGAVRNSLNISWI